MQRSAVPWRSEALDSQKRASDSLKLGLQMVVRHLVWVPGLNSGPLATSTLFFFLRFIYFIYKYSACISAGQKRAPDLITGSYGCWELGSGPLGEQSMLLASEPSLQVISPTP